MIYYTYSLYDPVLGMEYIGSRIKGVYSAEEDSNYRGSVKSKKWISEWKEISERCFKTILKTFKTAEEALAHEIFLHKRHDVGKNPLFFNGAIQTSTGFKYFGGGSRTDYPTGYTRSEETKRKISETLKARGDNGRKGKKHSEETRLKMRIAHQRRKENGG